MQKNSEAVFLFDGQGSQYYGMGKDLYDSCTTFRNILLDLDAEAYRVTGYSIIEHIYNAKEPVFDQLRFSHPAIYMIQYALAVTLQEDFDIHPVHALGNNLGEAVAAAVCGATDPVDMLLAVMGQASALEKHCEKGGMITVLQNSQVFDAKPEVCKIYEAATLVTINYCGHFTISAPTEALDEIKAYLEDNDIPYQQLSVNVALHSPMIDTAKSAFLENSRHISINKPLVSFISGIHARELYHLSPHYWWQTMREQTRFSDAIRFLESKGKYFYIDCSPSGGLHYICKHIISRGSGSALFGIMNAANEGMQNLQLLKRRPDLSLPVIYRNSL